MTKTTCKPAARKPKSAARSGAPQRGNNRRKGAPIDVVKAKASAKSSALVSADAPATAKAAEITTRGGLTKPARTTKLMLIIGLLRRDEGATLAELTAVTGWQAHSVRGDLAGTLRQRGFVIASTKTDGIRRYRITEVDPAGEASS